MNQEQFLGTLRDLLKILGSILATAGAVSDANWILWSGVIITIAPFGWSIYERTKARMIAKVDAMPEVAGVVTKPTQAGKALAAEVPSPTVIPAGTAEAVSIAKNGAKL